MTFRLNELDCQLTYDDVNFEFENLMGGGVVGSAANMVINVVGNSIIEAEKKQLLTYVRKTFHQALTDLL